MQLGYIVAKAYTSDAQIPIQNATFNVLSTDNDNQAILGVRLTDKNGKTEPIIVPAHRFNPSVTNSDICGEKQKEIRSREAVINAVISFVATFLYSFFIFCFIVIFFTVFHTF